MIINIYKDLYFIYTLMVGCEINLSHDFFEE